MTTEHALAFGHFVLDPVAGGLYGNSRAVALTPRALALLEYLAVRSGRLASTGELLDALWPHAWVTDGVLKVCVREIRRGYRFIAPVERAHRVGIGRPSASPASVGSTHGRAIHEFITSPQPFALASSTGCDSLADGGHQEFVPYRADYFFYTGP